jgi:cobalt-zinc-cadmium efflux system outer membrane protein
MSLRKGHMEDRDRTWRAIAMMAVLVARVAHVAPLHAQSAPEQLQHTEALGQSGPPLSLAAAIQETLANNPELLALRKEVETARFKPAEERFLAPPMLESQIWQWPINTLNPANTNMYMFMATQDLPGRGKRALRAAAAEKEVAVADVDVEIRARQILDDVKQQYASLFVARKAIEIHLASADLLRQFADLSQAKYSTGRMSQQDVLKSVVELSKLHDDLIMFHAQADGARLHLNMLMSRIPDAPIGPLTDAAEQVLVAPVADLQRIALDEQPELRMARVKIDQAEAQLKVARSEYKPDFSVTGGYMLMPNMTDAWMGRIGVTWPKAPWARGRLDARVAEANAAIDAAKARQRAMENAVRLAVSDAYVRVKAAEQRAALLRTTILPQSHQTLDVSRVAYQTDRVDFLALIENQRTLLDAELAYFRALSDRAQALADLERALGTELLPTQTVPVDTREGR